MINYDILLTFILALVAWALVRLARVVEAHRREVERQGYGLREAIEHHARVLESYTLAVHSITAGLSSEDRDA